MNGLLVRALLSNPTASLEAAAVGATAGSVLTSGPGGFQFANPSPYIPAQYTFATLPVAPVVGQTAVVTDSTVNTWGAAITVGLGTDVVLAWWQGTNWTVIGI